MRLRVNGIPVVVFYLRWLVTAESEILLNTDLTMYLSQLKYKRRVYKTMQSLTGRRYAELNSKVSVIYCSF